MRARVGHSGRVREMFHSYSSAICPTCRKFVDGKRILRDGKVFLRKQCSACGASEALISGDAEWFLGSLTYARAGTLPLRYSTAASEGCPVDCGLCPEHEQHTCLPIIEITNRCNLECPICLVQNRHNYDMSQGEFVATIDGLIEKEGTLDTVNLSGGEPTIHPEFLDLLDLARRPEIGRISVSTNGVRLARDVELCKELERRNVYVNLQVDTLQNSELQDLRGNGDHSAVKSAVLDNLERAGVPTSVICTVARGVNDSQIGECVRLLCERDFILSLLFQPAAYTGYGGARFLPHDPLDVMTIPDVVRCIEEQTEGLFRRSDFLPLPCSHSSCFALTYLLKAEDGFVPFPRFVPLDGYLDLIANRGTIRPDQGLEDVLRRAIDDLWSSSGQIPDGEKILSTLKRILRLLYPEDRALEIEERTRVGEGLVKTIFIHAFMDEHTFELERIKKCCTHYALPDGRLMPGCAYNMFYRHEDPRFAGPRGKAELWNELGRISGVGGEPEEGRG